MKYKFKTPENWDKSTLEKIAKWGSGGTPLSTNKEYYSGNIPWLIIGDLNDSYINSSQKTITELGLKNSSAKIVKPDSVLIAMYGSIGKLGINKIPVATNQAIAFTDKLYPNVYNKFLFYYLYLIRPELHKLGKGGTQKNISQTVLKQIPFAIPPINEQHQIVDKLEELFSELDKGIENLKTAQQQLKVYRQAVLKWAFEGKLTNENVKDGELPEGWSFVTLGSHIKKIDSGKSYKCDERPPKVDEVGIIKVSSVTWGEFDEQESKTCFSNDLFNEKYQVKEGDFLFSRANTLDLVGACVIVKAFNKTLMLSDKILRFLFDETLNKKYALFYLKSKTGKRQIADLSTGNQESMRNIGQEKIKQIIIPFCKPSEQSKVVREIESRLSICDNIEETISNSLRQAEALKQSILKKAFEGKLIHADAKKGAKIVSITATRDVWQRKVLAGKIIFACHKERSFGTTKFQKLLYLCEQHSQLDFDTHYVKQTAGPLDAAFIYPFIREAEKGGWFVQETDIAPFHFEPLNGLEQLTNDYPKFFKSVGDKINSVIGLLKDKNTDDSELVATIYAIWNNYIIQRHVLDAETLINEVYDWSKSKAKFSKQRILAMWKWMKEVGLVPVGFGRLI